MMTFLLFHRPPPPSMGGSLEFYDCNDMTLMNAVEHTAATDLEWDPTGRYVVTSVSIWNQKVKIRLYLPSPVIACPSVDL